MPRQLSVPLDTIRGWLKEAADGRPVRDICEQHDIKLQTFRQWQKKFGSNGNGQHAAPPAVTSQAPAKAKAPAKAQAPGLSARLSAIERNLSGLRSEMQSLRQALS